VNFSLWPSVCLLLALPAWAGDDRQTAPVSPYQPLTAGQRWRLYTDSVVRSPMTGFRVAAGATLAHLRDEPPDWGPGGAGLGRRVSHRFGRLAVQESFEAAGAALLRHEVRYLPSPSAGFWTRTGHAMAANFVTLNRCGQRTWNAAHLGGITAAELVSRRWMPDRYRTPYRTVRGIGIQLGFSTAANLVREFAPELKRLVRRK